jgi:NAD(P)-dependent dehydrogenase (short-subunit alcohol dehydrogenase family)
VVPLLLDAVQTSEHPPTLIFTSATAAMKGSANCSAFATGKFAMRALAQSLAREFGPKGVHVNHAIIDGVIDIERTKGYKFEHEDAKIKPEAVRCRINSHGLCLACSLVLMVSRLRTHTGGSIYSRGHASRM